jgi:hypothetical protein
MTLLTLFIVPSFVDFIVLDKNGWVNYKINCDVNQHHPFCNGEIRTDFEKHALFVLTYQSFFHVRG